MPMRLLRHPQAARRIHPVVLREVESALNKTAYQVMDWYEQQISGWEGKPVFSKKVVVNKKSWGLLVKVDGRTVEGKRFNWADLGTGERGGGEAYIIRPRDANQLAYEVPTFPKTTPSGPINQAPPGVYFTDEILHPGIWPRKWSKELLDMMQDRSRSTTQFPPGFRAVIEAAVKRAFRKRGIY